MDQAILQLYLDPKNAAQQLAQLADDELRDEIRERLAAFAAADHRPEGGGDDSAYIYLTWRFAELPAATRHILRRLGFGFSAKLFNHAPAPLKSSPRLVLAGTMLVMLALAAFVAAITRWVTPEPPRLVVQDAIYNHPALTAQTVRLMEPIGVDRYRVTLGSARQTLSLPNVPAGAEIPVIWRWQEAPSAIQLKGSDQCGATRRPVGAADPGLQ